MTYNEIHRYIYEYISTYRPTFSVNPTRESNWYGLTSEIAPPLPAYPSVMMSAKRCGLASLLLNIKGLIPEILSFAVNVEFYFTSLLLGFPRRLVVARKPVFRLTARNE